MAEPEPWQGAASGGPVFLLQTGLSQPHLRAPVLAMEAPGAQASLFKDWPQTPQLPTFLGCLGSPLGLQQRKDRIPKLPVQAVSLAEGRGEREFLRFLHLEAWRERLSSARALGGLPALDQPTGPPPSATVRPSTIPSAWNAVPHIYQHDPLSPPSLCSDFTSLPRPTCGTLINCTPPRADLLFPRALPLPNMLGGLNHEVPESKTPTDFKDSYEKII